MGTCRAEVAAQVLRRHEDPCPPLDLLPLERVVRVRGPHTLDALEDPQVDPRPARGTGLDLQARRGGAQLVDQPVDGGDLAVRDRLEQVTVVVPLEVGERVLAHEREEAVQHVGVRLRVGQVERALEPPGRRRPVTEHPVRVGAGECRVGADHLGLDPQAEVHPARVDELDERVQALGPDDGIDRPVPQRPAVVAAAGEPAVVQDEALDPDLGSGVDEPGEHGEVVVEVDGLPGVEHDRAGAAQGRARADVGVEPRRDPVEPLPGPRGDHPGCGVRLPRRQAHLSGGEQLTEREHRGAERLPVDVDGLVAAPRQVGRPDLARAEGEARRPDDGQEGVVMAGPAVARLPAPRPEAEARALGATFMGPQAREVQDLPGPVGDREDGVESGELEAVGRVVEQSVPQPEHTVLGQLELRRHDDGRCLIGTGQADGAAVALHTPQAQPTEGTAGRRPERLERRVSRPALGRRGKDRQAQRHVDRAGPDGGCCGVGERGERLVVQVTEPGAPVDDRWQPHAAGIQHEAGARGTQVVDQALTP